MGKQEITKQSNNIIKRGGNSGHIRTHSIDAGQGRPLKKSKKRLTFHCFQFSFSKCFVAIGGEYLWRRGRKSYVPRRVGSWWLGQRLCATRQAQQYGQSKACLHKKAASDESLVSRGGNGEDVSCVLGREKEATGIG